jgi:hypothetical protein
MNNGNRGVARPCSAHSVLGFAIDDYHGALSELVTLGAGDVAFAVHDTANLTAGAKIVFATPAGNVFNTIAAINAPVVSLGTPIVASFAYGKLLHGAYVPPFMVNIACKQMVCLHVGNFAKNISCDANDGLNKSFAIIYRKQSNRFTQQNYFKIMTPALSMLEKLYIVLENADGSAFDSQNQDHVLEFLVTYSSSANYN